MKLHNKKNISYTLKTKYNISTFEIIAEDPSAHGATSGQTLSA